MSETSIKIRFGAPEQQADTSTFSMVLHLQKQQIQKIHQEISKATSKYRIPFLVVETPESFREFNFQLASKILEQEIKFQTVSKNQRAYHFYQPNNLEIIAPLRKIQNLLQKLNTLHNTFFVNVTLCNFQSNIQKTTGLALNLMENMSLQAKLDLDKNFVKLASQLIAKISPGFDQSPMIGFLELFGGVEVDLQQSLHQLRLQSPSVLSNATREAVLPHQFEVKVPGQDKQGQILNAMLKDKQPMKVYLNFGKLGTIQFSGEARLWAFLSLVL